MKRLLIILILTFSFQTFAKADDIRDFEIEGMSIGDTLLQYYSEDQIIKKSKPIFLGEKKYYEWNQIYKENNNKLYDRVALIFKVDDKNYIIKKISGRNYYKNNNINECYDTQITIENEIAKLIPNIKKTGRKEEKNPNFLTGSSYQTVVYFDFIDDSYIGISCMDFSKNDSNSRDRLSVFAVTKEYEDWQHSKNKK